MKKFLSIILALTMLVSLVPSAFATDGETEAQEYSGITVKYDFTKFEGAAKDVDTKSIVTSYEKSYGFWMYNTSGHSRTVPLKQVTDQKTQNTALCVNYGPANTIDNDKEETTTNKIKDFYLAYEICVPKSGKYDIILENMQSGSCGADAQVFIFQESESFTYTTLTSEWSSDEKGHQQGGVFSYCNKTLGDDKFISTYVDLEDKYFDKGNYVVVFAAVEAQAGDGLTYANRYMGPMKLILDGDGENAENAVPMSMVASVDKTELNLDTADTMAQMTAKVYMSDLTEVADIITYESSDEKVASVDETGKVTALSYGVKPVTITAKAEANGVSVEGSEEITVKKTGLSIAYNVGTDALAKKSDGYLTALTKDSTNNFYRYYGMGTTSATKPGEAGSGHLRNLSDAVIGMRGESTLAFEVYIPESGFYTMEMQHPCKTSGKMAAVYLGKDGEVSLGYQKRDKLGEKIGSYLCYSSSNTTETSYITGVKIDEPGWYVISFTLDDTATAPVGVTWGTDIYIGDFKLISGEGGEPAPMEGMIKLGADALEVGETTTAEAIKYLSDGNPAGEATISAVASSNEDVVKVDGNTATAVGAGKATLSATVTYNGNTENLTREVTVTDKPVSGTASLGVYSEAGVPTVTATGYDANEPINSLAIGTQVTVTADTSDSNYIFRGWKRGSRDHGVWLSTEETVSFPLMTHTFLTAVYDEANAEDTVDVEFYNYKGQYLDTAENVGDATFESLNKPTPVLTGYTTYFWTLNGVDEIANDATFEKLTRVVAKFNDEARESFDVTIGTGIAGAESDEYAYDTKLELSSGEDGIWYVNNKPVACGNSYNHYVWGKADIEFKAEDATAPIISIDPEVKANGARLISYDANGKSIIEVGILFGENATVGSFSEGKAASKATGGVSGQFTAMPNSGSGENARGYLIYNDNGTYRVIYAD